MYPIDNNDWGPDNKSDRVDFVSAPPCNVAFGDISGQKLRVEKSTIKAQPGALAISVDGAKVSVSSSSVYGIDVAKLPMPSLGDPNQPTVQTVPFIYVSGMVGQAMGIPISAMRFLPDESAVVCGTSDGEAYFCDITTSSTVRLPTP
jgi:hypothetical protein